MLKTKVLTKIILRKVANMKKKILNTRNNANPFKVKCFYCNEYASHKSNVCPCRKEGSTYFSGKETEHRTDQTNFNNNKSVNTANNNTCPSDKILKIIEIMGKG